MADHEVLCQAAVLLQCYFCAEESMMCVWCLYVVFVCGCMCLVVDETGQLLAIHALTILITLRRSHNICRAQPTSGAYVLSVP